VLISYSQFMKIYFHWRFSIRLNDGNWQWLTYFCGTLYVTQLRLNSKKRKWSWAMSGKCCRSAPFTCSAWKGNLAFDNSFDRRKLTFSASFSCDSSSMISSTRCPTSSSTISNIFCAFCTDQRCKWSISFYLNKNYRIYKSNRKQSAQTDLKRKLPNTDLNQ